MRYVTISVWVLIVAVLEIRGSRDSPIRQVLSMLQGLLEKAKTEKGDDSTRFSQFTQLCTSVREEKKGNIEDSQEAIMQLKADSQKADVDAANLAREILALDADISEIEADMRRATHFREKGKAQYQAEHHDYSASIESAELAVQMIHQGNSLVESSLLALGSKRHVGASARGAIESYVQSKPMMMQDSLALAAALNAPEANVFESSSDGILGMVENLSSKFTSEKAQLEKEEQEAIYASQMAIQDLTNRHDSALEARSSKAGAKAQREQAKAEADADLSNAEATLAEDEKFFKDNNAECERKSAEYEARQVLRGGEITALQKAFDIISSDRVVGAGIKHLPILAETRSAVDGYVEGATSLAQLRSSSTSHAQNTEERQHEVAAFLAERAREHDSRVLSLISLRVKNDPFKKVSQMIKTMITKLMEEANEEAEHKGFCDTEMSQNKKTRESKTEVADTLHAVIDELSAALQKLADETSVLSEALRAMDAAMLTATKLRQVEKAKNAVSIADAKTAQGSVASAIGVLRDYYETASFTQTSDGSDDSSSGSGDFVNQVFVQTASVTQDSKGVLGILDVIASDFARLESNTQAAEMDSDRTFREFTNDSNQNKAVKSADFDYKMNAKQEKSLALAHARHDLKGVLQQLNAGMEYLEKLKPSCVNAEADYADRVQTRKEEIDALKEALHILSGDDIAI